MSLGEYDMEAIGTAVRILNEAGYRVEKSNQGQRSDSGVGFKLEVHAPTRSPWFKPQSEEVREAAIECAEYGMGGERIEEGDSE